MKVGRHVYTLSAICNSLRWNYYPIYGKLLFSIVRSLPWANLLEPLHTRDVCLWNGFLFTPGLSQTRKRAFGISAPWRLRQLLGPPHSETMCQNITTKSNKSEQKIDRSPQFCYTEARAHTALSRVCARLEDLDTSLHSRHILYWFWKQRQKQNHGFQELHIL